MQRLVLPSKHTVEVRSGASIGEDLEMEWFTDAGLGLDYEVLRLERTDQQWLDAGTRLCEETVRQLGDLVASIEHIGSSSVSTLLAKPIIDLAVGLSDHDQFALVRDRLVDTGWIYRGDAGVDGGHVFVLETRPWHRVAHIHVVEYDGEQWRNYLRLREVLRRSADARARYEAAKQQLVVEFGDDRKAYTDGKSAIVRSLLADADTVT